MNREGPKERLLAAVIEHMAANGAADLSLRQLAVQVGTSHRMLLYHFGSKEQLLVEVIGEVEARQQAMFIELLTEFDVDPHATPLDLMRAFWQRIADPALHPYERLFFEMYGQALQRRPGTTQLLDGVIDSWLEPMAELGRRHGLPDTTARAQARLGIAVARGLLLDLLATGDRVAVDAAADLFFTDARTRLR
ncbi:TetR/AcrR family transcriptional regulator [Streptomyces incanus]|uniref:TetR/AcrR family transcriptional regulator n=1 Tax=Streptomyces incanus TaxID=887453 RepID=A0ABW0Y191_9ACTN